MWRSVYISWYVHCTYFLYSFSVIASHPPPPPPLSGVVVTYFLYCFNITRIMKQMNVHQIQHATRQNNKNLVEKLSDAHLLHVSSKSQYHFNCIFYHVYMILLNTVQWLFNFKQFDWFGGHRLSAHEYSSIDYNYMENTRKLNLFSNKYLPVKNNLLLYLVKLYLIKQLLYSTFWILADYNRFTLHAHLLFIS